MNGAVGGRFVVLFLIVCTAAVAAEASAPAASIVKPKAWRESPVVNAPVDDDADRYCRICRNHTMCLFPFDDPARNCFEVESGDLEVEEIEWLVHQHNLLRDNVAQKIRKLRSRLPPRAAASARDMLQVFWDEELAKIARRWALQCNMFDKDACRNVERFAVMQNVNALDLQEVGNRTAVERLKFHTKTWYDEEKFATLDALGVREATESGIGLLTPMVTKVGCGRAIYKLVVEAPRRTSRIETLVCNYGPNDPIQMGSNFVPRKCERRSSRYRGLCLKLQEGFSQGVASGKGRGETRKGDEEEVEEAEGEDTELEEDEELSFRMQGGDEELRSRWENAGKVAGAGVAPGSAASAAPKPPDYLFLVAPSLLLLFYCSPFYF